MNSGPLPEKGKARKPEGGEDKKGNGRPAM